jgi:ribosomal protein L37AE/L43A
MKKNEIQMQPGLSLSQFINKYGTEQKCEEALEKSRWPDGFRCPECGDEQHYRYRRNGLLIFQCTVCREKASLTQNTIFHSTKLPLVKWFQAMFFMTQNKNNISILELKRHLGVVYSTAWRIKHKLMQVMYEREATTRLHGRVEVDDAYLGGENPGGKAGRGSENKVPFIAAIQTNTSGNPMYAVFQQVKSFSLDEVVSWAKRSLLSETVVVSDGLSCFTAVEKAGCIHQREVVGKDRKSTDMECFSWINTILGNVKTAICGTYHAFDFEKYGYRYLGEHQYRFNRRFDLSTIFPRLVYAATHTEARPERILRLAVN